MARDEPRIALYSGFAGARPPPRAAPVVRAVTEQAIDGWWTTDVAAGWGQQRTIEISSARLGESQSIVYVDRLGEPGLVTIALQRLSEPLGPPVDVEAELEYGVGSVRDTIRCDWALGLQITVPATSIRLSAVTVPIVSLAPGGARSIRLGAHVGRGSRAAPEAVTLTRMAFVFAAGAALMPVPDYARWVAIAADTLAYAATTTYRFLDLSGATLQEFVGTAIGPTSRVPIPGAARTLRVANGGAATMLVSAIWGLDL